MPLTKKGQKIKRAMKKTYKNPRTAERVFYASKNAGKITGVDQKKRSKQSKKALK